MKSSILLTAGGSILLGFALGRLRDASQRQANQEEIHQLKQLRDDLQSQVRAANEDLARFQVKAQDANTNITKERNDLGAANDNLLGQLKALEERVAKSEAHRTELQKLERQREEIRAKFDELKQAFDLTKIRKPASSRRP